MKPLNKICKVGIDIGSTTLKVVILDHTEKIIYKIYRRHKANINKVFAEELYNISKQFTNSTFAITITGSAGMGISERTGIPFIQEVVSSVEVIRKIYPETKTMIDLGGEDAKMVFFNIGKQPDIRMNGSCAGGTGSFIDQMADLANISVEELGTYAREYEKIYPVASRCGVFAKTDVQNLISKNIRLSDISKSILHAVALQSITSLARGYEVVPPVLCIGGPLTFIPELRKSFAELLHLNESDIITPAFSEYFPAWGCALSAETGIVTSDLETLAQKAEQKSNQSSENELPALFSNETEYRDWKKKRKIKPLKKREMERGEQINCFLGIDSGSTTTKILILDDQGYIIYSFYDKNEGNPLGKVTEGLSHFYKEAKDKDVSFRFLSSASTGYGEELIKSALNLDYGIVETMSHLTGAQYVDREVSFILDIGGQDMKSIFIRDGVISNIELNEACSSGCGSFLQNFASTINIAPSEFGEKACVASCPRDLGTRCTVFMNSKVKQSLRENASPGDIAAGLAYSVVKNCLFKVLKISNLNQLGDHIVVQGGTFRNDAVYRALELLSGKTIGSTDHPELMGALGASLYAKKRWEKKTSHETQFTGQEALEDIRSIQTKELTCKGCSNKCTVLRFKFANGNISYAGNKCEKIFFGKGVSAVKGYNGFDLKTEILFKGENTHKQEDQKKTVGIPRVLNMYENFPFWETLFTECGYEVVLSPESDIPLYQKGVGSVMSDNICFPAKLVHGHILALADEKVDRIFYPIVPKEKKEFNNSCNSFNCPVVSGYPDVVRSSMEPEEKFGIPFDKPVISFHSEKALKKACLDYLSGLGVSRITFEKAFKKAIYEWSESHKLIQKTQKRLFEKDVKDGKIAFIVAGRPYHADPLIHQKVGQILADLGADVFTDDIFRSENNEKFQDMNIISQWSYPNRVAQAAMVVGKLPQNIQLIQLNSFGCGPDSFFIDEISNLLKQAGKNHTVLRIDEIASPGSIRLRLRSLIESLKQSRADEEKQNISYKGYNASYTRKDREKTIIIPWFTDFLSPFIPAVAELAGYKIENLPKSSRRSAELGLKYGNNEVCYPSTLILGDIIMALQSGKYDLNNIVVAITQTGGQCRATNYVAQIKSGLNNAGFGNIPVLVVSSGKVYQNDQEDFSVPYLRLSKIILNTLLYADGLQQMYNTITIREKNKGDAQNTFDFYIERGIENIRLQNPNGLINLMHEAVADFNLIPIQERSFTQVGLVGEIYVKYNNQAQAHIGEWLQSQEMEVVTPPFLDFGMQYFINSQVNINNGLDKKTLLGKFLNPVIWKILNKKIKTFENILSSFRFHRPSESIYVKAQYASEILDLSNQFGEGWLIAAEVAHYARQGINRIVCLQPFGCIANHIVAKGIEKRLKKIYPDINLLFLDIDNGVSKVNMQNRLHFLINEI